MGRKKTHPWIGLAVAGAVGVGLWFANQDREITLEELEQHKSIDAGLWIAWQDPETGKWMVSAMADFAQSHPGGSMIEQAGGGAAMPHWQKYARHLGPTGNPTPQVLVELKKRVVGVLTEAPPNAKVEDPYALEPDRLDYDLHPLQQRPYNAGQKPLMLGDYITDVSQLFVRFHTPSPLVRDYSLAIESLKGKTFFTLDSFKEFQELVYISVLQCTGHRRSEVKPETNGLQWEAAVANVEMRGYRLWDVLRREGVQREAGKYLLVEQLDERGTTLFSSCIPLMDLPEDTMLATHMNGDPLTRDHGAPVRLFVPGFNGNFSVKRPDRIRIVDGAAAPQDKVAKYAALGHWAPAIALSDNLPAYVADNKGKLSFESELRVNSLAVVNSSTIKASAEANHPALVRGWAWTGGGREIVSVQFSTNGGRSWEEAELTKLHGNPHAWTGWEATIPVGGKKEILIRARDSAGNIQPEQSEWNPRGLRNNSWLRLPIGGS